MSDGTPIVSSTVTGGAITGTVSVVNLTTGKRGQEIPVGLQPTALYLDGSALLVANSNDDSMSVIDRPPTRSRRRSAPTRCRARRSAATPTRSRCPIPPRAGRSGATTRSRSVPLQRSCPRRSDTRGCCPTDWYPVQVAARPGARASAVVVTNDKGIGARGPESTIDKGPYTSQARHRPQHLRRHRQRHRLHAAEQPVPAQRRHPDRVHRQRLEPDQADQQRRLRHRAVGDPGEARRQRRRSSTSS